MAVAAQEQVGRNEQSNEHVDGQNLAGVREVVGQDDQLHGALKLVRLISVHEVTVA